MNNGFSLVSEISLPLGSVGLDGSHGGSIYFIEFLVAMPRVAVLRYSLRQSFRLGGADKLPVPSSFTFYRRIIPIENRCRICFTPTTLYSRWPVGLQFDMAREFGDLFLLLFYQWPAGMHSNRSEIFKSEFNDVWQQANATVAAMQGVFIRPNIAIF